MDRKADIEKIGHIRCKSKADLQNVRLYNVRVKFEAENGF